MSIYTQNGKINITQTRFNFIVETVQLDDEYSTTKIVLADMLWHIKIRKETNSTGRKVVNVCFVCSPPILTLSMDWICEATATVALLSIASIQEPFVKNLPKTKFSKNSTTIGWTPFATLDEFKQYEQNGMVLVDVELSANPVKLRTTSEIQQTGSKFRFTIENVSQLNRKSSPEVTVQGANWYVVVKKSNDFLSAYLYKKRNIFNANWFWKTKCSFKLTSFRAGTPPICKQFDDMFGYKTYTWGYIRFVSWKDLMDPAKKYVQDDKAILDISLEVDFPKPLWDIDENSTKNHEYTQECSICQQKIVATKCDTCSSVIVLDG